MRDRVIYYFTRSGFLLTDTNKNDKLTFIHRSSFFDAWKTNPLKWGAEICVFIKDTNGRAGFYIDTDSQMNTMEEENVWNSFIANFKNFLTDRNEFKGLNTDAIAEVNKSRLACIGWTVLGALTGGLIGMWLFHFTGSKIIGYMTIPVFATLFLTNRIHYRKEKNTL